VTLRVALVVPDERYDYDNPRHAQLPGLVEACRAGEVDLVVLPEAYYESDDETWQTFTDSVVEYFGVPLLIGVLTAQGFNVAQYRNPDPDAGETTSQIYVKHSTSGRLAFDWPDYRDVQRSMFEPIILKGRRIGLQICHDMFFGLLGQRWRTAGADTYVNITGGGVNERKWTNMVRARSVDLNSPYLCAMSIRERGTSKAFAYRNGLVLPPMRERWNKSGSGWAIVDVDAGTSPEVDGGQDYTENVYRDITVALGAVGQADVTIRNLGGKLVIEGATRREGDGWFEFDNRVGRTGLLPLPLAALTDGLAIHRADAPKGTFDHHIVVFHSPDDPAETNRLLDQMKARAIEHRIGVLMLAGRHREAVKTNRYKNIQRFRAVGDVFGFDANFLGGTWSTAGTSDLGIGEGAFLKYLAFREWHLTGAVGGPLRTRNDPR